MTDVTVVAAPLESVVVKIVVREAMGLLFVPELDSAGEEVEAIRVLEDEDEAVVEVERLEELVEEGNPEVELLRT